MPTCIRTALSTLVLVVLASRVTSAGQNVYVSMASSHRIFEFDSTGVAQQVFNLDGSPYGMVGDATGNVYVSNVGLTNSILKITPDGQITTIPFGIAQPVGIAMDTSGNLYVTANVPYVYKITPQGTITTFAATSNYGYGLAFDAAGNLFESLPQDGRVIKISPDGKSATTFAIGLTDPGGLAFDRAGNLFVGSGFAQRITKITPDGTQSLFAYPVAGGVGGLAFDAQQNLYGANYSGPAAILKFNSSGVGSTFVSSLGGEADFVAVSPVPEPGMLGLIAAAVIAFRRRRGG